MSLDDLGQLARQDWRDDARCSGAAEDFIDVTNAEAAEYLIHKYCSVCPSVDPCREYGDQQKPAPWHAVYGGRLYVSTKRTARSA